MSNDFIVSKALWLFYLDFSSFNFKCGDAKHVSGSSAGESGVGSLGATPTVDLDRCKRKLDLRCVLFDDLGVLNSAHELISFLVLPLVVAIPAMFPPMVP